MSTKFGNTFLGKRFALTLLAGVITSSAVLAVESTPTSSVIGRAPSMAAPTISHNDVNGNTLVDAGDILTAVLGTFSDLDGDVAATPLYRWNDGAANIGSNPTYTVQAADVGKDLYVYVTPTTDSSITDPAEGLEVSAMTGTTAMTVVSVAITGFTTGTTPLVGTQLTATPTCNVTCDGNQTYQWMIETTPGSGNYSAISGATTSTYTPTKDDQRRMIKVDVN